MYATFAVFAFIDCLFVFLFLSQRYASPVVVYGSPMVKCWHKLDRTFLMPKVEVLVHIISASSYDSPRAAELSELYVLLLNDSLAEYSYQAELAGLHYSVALSTTGFRVCVLSR